MFDPVDPKQSFPDLERDILQYWREEDTFRRSIQKRTKKDGDSRDDDAKPVESSFSFYDGPPFATGLPHYGHLLAGTIKDVIPRYQTMRGKRVERRFGWDCHGLPVEYEIEKEHKIGSKKEIEEMGVAKFNALCRGAVQRFTKEWRTTVERMGRWVDMDNDYRTMDPDYMESIWWVFKQLHDKGLIYEGYKGMYICPRCATPLANFEVTQGYADRKDLSVIVTFPLKDDPNAIILAWTTTPWSLPGNLWLAVGPHIEYSVVEWEGKKYILAQKLVEKVFKGRDYAIVGSMKPQELVGKHYEPLFPYFVDTVLPSTIKAGQPETYGKRANRTVINDAVEVSDEEGTGIVHITSSTGEDSYAVARSEGVDVLHHVTIDGYFVPAVKDFIGLHVKPEGKDPMATDRKIIDHLKNTGRFFSEAVIKHSYPHCWRCDTPLIPYTTSCWYVAVDKIKEKMQLVNKETAWVPAHLRDGRFGKWLEGARDWAISRNRYWGTPLPIWKNEATGEIDVLGSRDDLMRMQPQRFTKVTVLRHGESQGNISPVYQGKVPGTDLTLRGKKQAKEAAKVLAEQDVHAIYSSPLARTEQTAKAVAKETGARIVVDERLKEVSFGDFEGKHVDFSDLAFTKARRAHKLQTGQVESIYHFPGMETWAGVEGRTSDFLRSILGKHRGEHVVIVTHADPLLTIKHFFHREDPQKLSRQPYPTFADPVSFYWDHETNAEMDLHKETVDGIAWSTPQGTFKRIPDVLDCWFESGSMPYAQSHFPFNWKHAKHKRGTAELLPPGFPADFIAEGIDQTRGWFYTLMVLSTALFDQPAFYNCIVNGTVLAEDGKKMSKRLKNYPEPLEVVERRGADAVRFALMSSPAVRGEDLRFSEKIVEDALRGVLLPLWNAYVFFVTYANEANWLPTGTRAHSAHPLDTWIRAETQDLVNRMTEQLEAYDLSATCAELSDSIDALTNWYVRLSRRRFAGKSGLHDEISGDQEEDQIAALSTLQDVLLTLCQLLAPFAPFITEAIYVNLVREPHGSIHLTDWPEPRKLTATERSLLEKTRLLRSVVSLGLKLRAEKKIKNRQPLQSATVAIPSSIRSEPLTEEELSLLREELNVKRIEILDDPSSLAQPIVQVDARKVGPRIGGRVQEIIAAGKRGEFTQKKNGSILILEETLSPDEAAVVYVGREGKDIAADRGIVVSLDTAISPVLLLEGCGRDLIRAIQQERKSAGLSINDRITLNLANADDIVASCGEAILRETNASLGSVAGKDHDVVVNGKSVTFRFQKIPSAGL